VCCCAPHNEGQRNVRLSTFLISALYGSECWTADDRCDVVRQLGSNDSEQLLRKFWRLSTKLHGVTSQNNIFHSHCRKNHKPVTCLAAYWSLTELLTAGNEREARFLTLYMIHTAPCYWSNTQHSTNKCTLVILFLDITNYSGCRSVQHVSILPWDHQQGILATAQSHR
jgi:hypothetical protein